MKIKHERNLLLPEVDNSISKIECGAWSANGTKFAICTASNNQVVLFNGSTHEKKEKFALKATGKNFSKKSFVVKGIAFSPDSTKLAIGQTDCVIYVYRLGDDWGDKKSIVSKFTLQSPLTSLYWLESGIVFSTADGKVKLIQTSSNKMTSIVSTNSMAISLAVAGNDLVIGFLNGAIIMATVGSRETPKQLALSASPPFALTMTHSGYVAFGGCDGKITFIKCDYGPNSEKQTIEYGADISVGSSSPSGNIVVFASEDKLLVFTLDSQHWQQLQSIEMLGMCLITSLIWSKDGTKMAVGSVNGALELFSFQWKRKIIGEHFEVNYVGNSQVAIKDINSNLTAVFRSDSEIKDVKIVREQFAVIWTRKSLIVGDIQDFQDRTSEVDWSGMNQEGARFCFDYDGVVLVNLVGELHLIELGSNHMLSSVRTDFVNPHLMSVRVNERKSRAKVLAYLLDIRTICVTDLMSSIQLVNWSHDQQIDWIELNETGRMLLFRDKLLRLYILNILTQESNVLLNVCGFVQWVPNSDVIVAQARDKLYIWYDLQQPIIHEVPGGSRTEAVSIEREGGLTRVRFSGSNSDVILDEVLLEFDTALQDGDLERAMSFLESCELSSDSESMWRTLGNIALDKGDLLVAERAFAAVGDVTRTAFIHDCFDDQSKLSLLNGDWSTFEANDLEGAMNMYLKLNKWDKAIDLAVRTGQMDLKTDLEKRHYDWLLDSGQEAEAAQVMEKSGNVEEAIRLFLKSGRSVQAARAIIESKKLTITRHLVDSVILQLIESEFFEEAGELYELPSTNDNAAALENYVKGNAFLKAIDLARRHFPDEVVGLEAKFGEYLMVQDRDPAAAIGHLIEAGKSDRALEAAIQSGQFERAAEISSILDNVPSHYGRQIGDYYAHNEQIDAAIEMYLTSGCVREALVLLNKRGQYGRAFKMAKKLLDPDEANEMYNSIATSLQNEGKYKEAEKIYMTCDDVDSAISMYKSARQFDHMIRLVKQFHPDLLNDTHLHLARELERERQFHQAEGHFVAANEWKLAVQMFKGDNQWEEAYRVARAHGGAVAAKQVAYLWAKGMEDIESSVKMLSRFGLLHQVVEYSIECKSFEFAKELVRGSGSEMKHKLAEVNLKHALALEEEGQFEEAEKLFIEAGKAKEAVLMYIQSGSYSDAIRIAEQFVKDDTVVGDVLVAQSKAMLEKGRNMDSMNRAETLFIRAGRVELAVSMYKESKMWDDAFRICEQYAPNLIDGLRREAMMSRNSEADFDSMNHFSSRASSRRSSAQEQDRTRSRRSVDSRSIYAEDSDEEADVRTLLQRAESNGDRENIVRYSISLASQLVKDKTAVEALEVLSSHQGVFLVPDAKKIVLKIASELFSFDQQNGGSVVSWKMLRDALYQLNSSSENSHIEKAMMVSHYLQIKSVLQGLQSQNGVKELLLKVTVALLRYTDVVRVDKAFFEAGYLAKEGGKLEMAFVFWNHFLDLEEAIEEGELNVDHSDLEGTDIPSEVPLPSAPFHSTGAPSSVEEVKSWILQVSMDNQMSHSLPICAFREGDVYEASLVNADGSKCLPCIVTGYPVIRHKMLELKSGQLAANKDDWNKLLMVTKMSASDELKEVLLFIGKLCGNASIARFSFQ
ncbi:Intraflagellar transport protein -like protein [Halotydeus destructor]|nr:Intraflagellar transport protein -like protein [Halotydeus destructor]